MRQYIQKLLNIIENKGVWCAQFKIYNFLQKIKPIEYNCHWI